MTPTGLFIVAALATLAPAVAYGAVKLIALLSRRRAHFRAVDRMVREMREGQR